VIKVGFKNTCYEAKFWHPNFMYHFDTVFESCILGLVVISAINLKLIDFQLGRSIIVASIE